MTIYRDDLERVYALIERPEAWTQSANARDADGLSIIDVGADYDAIKAAQHPDACQWCLIGAFARFGLATDWRVPTEVLLPELDMAEIEDKGGGIARFNDTHTHPEVLALLKAAIERAPARPVQP